MSCMPQLHQSLSCLTALMCSAYRIINQLLMEKIIMQAGLLHTL